MRKSTKALKEPKERDQAICLRVPNEILDRFDAMCLREGRNRSRAIRMAMESEVNSSFTRNLLGTFLAGMVDYSDKPEIIQPSVDRIIHLLVVEWVEASKGNVNFMKATLRKLNQTK